MNFNTFSKNFWRKNGNSFGDIDSKHSKFKTNTAMYSSKLPNFPEKCTQYVLGIYDHNNDPGWSWF
jgi:hypothetical protein